ncbi:unnamed protein product, partial [Iphiclides podalirius]
MRVNMSMAIVDMTDVTKEDHFDWSYSVQSTILSSFFWGYVTLMLPSGELAKRFGGKCLLTISISINSLISVLLPTGAYLHFDWSYGVQSTILSSFFWGYVTLTLLSGELVKRFGGKCLFTISVSVNSLVSLLLPTGAYLGGWQFVCACRVLQGLTQSFIFPATNHIVSQWVPLEEKGRLSTLLYSGSQLGVALQLLISGFLASAWGWKAIFYVNGLLGVLWTITYLFFGSASPEQSKRMSQEELRYIQKSLGRVGEQKKYKTPLTKIITCLPFWAAVVSHCGQNWGFFTLMTEMPTYMAKVLDVNLTQNGVLSSLPYLAMCLLSFPVGAMTDLLVRRKWLSITNTRKLSNSIGFWGPALALIGLSYTPEGNMIVAVIMLTVTVGINAGCYAGFTLVLVDLAPNFSSSLTAISNFFASIVSIVAPLVCGIIIRDEPARSVEASSLPYHKTKEKTGGAE